jgi:hypothetical protein
MRRASSRSRAMAPISSAPTIACCQNEGTRRTTMALPMVLSSRAPRAAPTTEPLPPKIATPPTTTAEMTWSSKPVPAVASTVP